MIRNMTPILDIEEHIKKYLDTVSHTVKGEPHQQLLTTFLGKMVDLYTVMTYYFADAMEEVDRVAEDKGLKESLGRYAIESGAIMEQVYRKKMEVPIENMKKNVDGRTFRDSGGSRRKAIRKRKFRGTLTSKDAS